MRHRFAPLADQLVGKAFALARSAGGQGRLVGGAVRDWTIGRPIGDLDMAVNVPIAAFRKQAQAAAIRVIDTGLDHGSLTLCENGTCLEVTQTRKDISTDGRHAKIGFTPEWDEDARRRDFTINALYIDENGTLFDPVGGLADIKAGRLRFIGDAGARISEDYLRMLRLMRFVSQLEGFDADEDALTIVTQHLDGLGQLSGERIVQEIKKLCAGVQWQKAVVMMTKSGLDQALFGAPFLPRSPRASLLESWQGVLASLAGADGRDVIKKMPFSRADLRHMTTLWQPFQSGDFAALADHGQDAWQEVAYFNQAHLYERALIQEAFEDFTLSDERLAALRFYDAPPCPVSGDDLSKAGVAPGPEMGRLLQQAAVLFVKSGFVLSANDIITTLMRSQDDKDEDAS